MIEKEIMHCKTDADDWFIIWPEKSQQGKSLEMNTYLIVSNIWNSVASKNTLFFIGWVWLMLILNYFNKYLFQSTQ